MPISRHQSHTSAPVSFPHCAKQRYCLLLAKADLIMYVSVGSTIFMESKCIIQTTIVDPQNAQTHAYLDTLQPCRCCSTAGAGQAVLRADSAAESHGQGIEQVLIKKELLIEHPCLEHQTKCWRIRLAITVYKLRIQLPSPCE